MEPVLNHKEIIKLKHSKQGIIGFILFLSVLLPVIFLILCFKLLPSVYLSGLFNLNQARFFFDFLMIWIFAVPIIALIISAVDLKKPNRLKVLPKITVILDSIIIATAIIVLIVTAVSDINRMVNG